MGMGLSNRAIYNYTQPSGLLALLKPRCSWFSGFFVVSGVCFSKKNGNITFGEVVNYIVLDPRPTCFLLRCELWVAGTEPLGSMKRRCRCWFRVFRVLGMHLGKKISTLVTWFLVVQGAFQGTWLFFGGVKSWRSMVVSKMFYDLFNVHPLGKWSNLTI